MSLKNWIHTVSDFSDLVQFHFICQMLANFSGVKSERTVSKFRKRKRKLLRSLKPEHEIRKFHVPVMQWWLRSVQKTVMYMQSYWIAYINLLLFLPFLSPLPLPSPSPSLLLNLPILVTWLHTAPLYINDFVKKVFPDFAKFLELEIFSPAFSITMSLNHEVDSPHSVLQCT